MSGRKVNREEQTPARRMRRRANWDELVKAAEKVKKDRWKKWAERHGQAAA